MSSIGKIIAHMVPITPAVTAAHFSFILDERDTLETPAEKASRKVVVAVESITMRRPITPRPALSIITAISLSPVNIAADIPMMYIQQLTRPYTPVLTAAAATGFLASLV